jgi:hypothetical protein
MTSGLNPIEYHDSLIGLDAEPLEASVLAHEWPSPRAAEPGWPFAHPAPASVDWFNVDLDSDSDAEPGGSDTEPDDYADALLPPAAPLRRIAAAPQEERE